MGKPKLPTRTIPNKNTNLNKTINKRGDKIKQRSIQQFSKLAWVHLNYSIESYWLNI